MNLKSLIWLHKYPHNAEARSDMLNSGQFRSLGISEMVKLLTQNPGCDLDGDLSYRSGVFGILFFIITATAPKQNIC